MYHVCYRGLMGSDTNATRAATGTRSPIDLKHTQQIHTARILQRPTSEKDLTTRFLQNKIKNSLLQILNVSKLIQKFLFADVTALLFFSFKGKNEAIRSHRDSP